MNNPYKNQNQSDTDYEWRYHAKCRGEDTEIFFPPRDRALYTPIANKAKAICLGKDGRPPCVSRLDCLMDALEKQEEHGIWGGLSHRERNALERKYKKKIAQMNIDMTLRKFVENGGSVD